MHIRPLCACLLLSVLAPAPADDAAATPPRYANDFAKAAPGKLPDDEFLVLAGDFAVKDVDGDKLLEVAPYPLDTFAVLFGPAEHATGSISARVWAAMTGRRVPEFGVGSNDTGGYKLWLMPRQNLVEIRKADQTVATAPYDAWKSETWTHFRLTVTKAGDAQWKVQGRVWPAGGEEPKEWTISFDDTTEPPAGRASVWANPYSGKSVRFDDLRVEE